MKKNIIIIFTLLVLFIAINIWLLPNIDYTKIEYVEYSMAQSFSTNSEEVVDVTPNTITVQLALDYSFSGNLTDPREECYTLYTNQNKHDRQLKDELRAESKEYHKGKNNEIMKSIQATICQEIYVSSYAPFIDITYDLEYFNRHKKIKFDGHNWTVAVVDRYSQDAVLEVVLEEDFNNSFAEEESTPEIIIPDGCTIGATAFG